MGREGRRRRTRVEGVGLGVGVEVGEEVQVEEEVGVVVVVALLVNPRPRNEISEEEMRADLFLKADAACLPHPGHPVGRIHDWIPSDP